MQADFLDAHQRHWDDAQYLFAAARWANADHLYGMATECGLKGLMLALGMPFDHIKNRPANRDDRAHARDIWTRYESYRDGRVGAEYSLPNPNPFDDWDVSDRYAHQSHFDSVRVQPHIEGARCIRDLIPKAQRAGWLP